MADNRYQIDYWSGEGGAKWLAAEDRLERGLAQFGQAALKAAAPRPGERVLDIGCGTGGTTLKLAQAVAPGGAVGLDVSSTLLEAARRRARGTVNISFIEADASAHKFKPEFDLIFSRFGVMFFADPLAAFVNLRGALKPGGRLAFVCWRTFKENRWAFVPFAAAIAHLPPVERAAPDAPGPFAFADKVRVASILGGAGFADIAIEAVDGLVAQGADVDDAVDRVQQFGPTSALLAAAPAEMRTKAVAAVRAAFQPHQTKDGVALPGAVWIVTARTP